MDIHSIVRKKRTFKNIYCSSCDVWLSEYFLSCHLNSVFHENRFKKQTLVNKKPKVNKSNEKDIKSNDWSETCFSIDTDSNVSASILNLQSIETCKVSTPIENTPDHSQNSDYVIRGSTLKKREDIIHPSRSSPDLFSQVKQALFEKEQAHEYSKINDIPQNQLGLMDYDGNPWIIVNSDSDTSTKSPRTTECCENAQDGFDSVPLHLLSGTFDNTACTEEHLNQISFYRCARCNPNSYKDYENW